MDGGADILSSGRDPDQRSGWRVPRRLVAAAAAVALIGAGITLGLLLTGQQAPPIAAAAANQAQTVPAMLRGAPLRPDPSLGTLLLGGPGELRLLNAGAQVPGALGWANGLLGVDRRHRRAGLSGGLLGGRRPATRARARARRGRHVRCRGRRDRSGIGVSPAPADGRRCPDTVD